MASRVIGAVVGADVIQSGGWFPQLRELSLLGEVFANDADLMALSNLEMLEMVRVNAYEPKGGGGGGLTMRGVKELVQRMGTLMEVHITGGVHIDYRVPGRMPGVYGE